MNLERYVQASIRRQSTIGLTLLQAVPRVALAFALGLVISKPLLLKIFEPEIKAQVSIDRNAQRAAAQSKLKNQFAEVAKLKGTIASLETQLSTTPAVGKALGASPEYHALAKRYGKFQAEARSAPTQQAAEAEEHAAHATLEQMIPLRAELLAQEHEDNERSAREGSEKLQATKQELAPLKSELQRKETELNHRFQAPSGLADQDKALGILEHSNSSIGYEALLLRIFIVAVDILPALMKVLMALGLKSVYEERLEAKDEREIAEALMREDAITKEAERDVEDQLGVNEGVRRARSEKQAEAQKEMDDLSIRVLQKKIKPYVEKWARATAEEYGSILSEEMERQAAAARERRARSARHEGGGNPHTRSSSVGGRGRSKRPPPRRPD
jgi:hypothetical protein